MKYLASVALILLSVSLAFARPDGWSNGHKATPFDQDINTQIDVNSICMFVQNTGSFGRDDGNGGNAGLFFPCGQTNTIVYAAGLWMGGMIDDELHTTVAEFSYDYTPGQYLNGTFKDGSEDPAYKVYKINKGDTDASNPDYRNWPASQGAPMENGEPKVFGDQTLFAVYGDDGPNHSNALSTSRGLGIEVQHTTFAYNRADPLGKCVFFKLLLVNKGGHHIKDAYLSIWSDPDLGGAGDDLVGCDKDLSLGFCYNATNADTQYGSAPPSVGYDFFQGPLVPSPGDVAILPGGREFPDMKVLGMNSFNLYPNGVGPQNPDGAYCYMQGRNGQIATCPETIDPVTGLATSYSASGDPVKGRGWVDSNPGDRRLMLSTGPCDFDPFVDENGNGIADLGEPGVQEIVAAIVVGDGPDRLTSISLLRYHDRFAQDAFNNNFVVPSPPATPQVTVVPGDQEIVLYWGDESEADDGVNPYKFEGYNVYQIDRIGGNANTKLIASFDVRNDVTTILEDVFDPASQQVETRITRRGSDSGIQRSFHITQDEIRGLSLYNQSTYYFAVSAYSYNPTEGVLIKTLESSPKILESLNPQTGIMEPGISPYKPVAGDAFHAEYGEGLEVDHTGVSDGAVEAEVIDPSALTGDDYKVSFRNVTGDDGNICGFDEADHDEDGQPDHIAIEACTVWDLKTTGGRTVLHDQLQLANTNTSDLPITEGFITKVAGPLPGIKRCDVFDCPDDNTTWGWDIPKGTRRFTFASADMSGFGVFEGFQHAIGWSTSPCMFGGGCGEPTVPASNIKQVKLVLATVADGAVSWNPTFDVNDPNVSYAYRYLRGANAAPAKPEFAPFFVNKTAGYAYQDYVKSVPLAAYDMDVTPPRRLALAFMENNNVNGLVDGKYWPRSSADAIENTATREWLFILNADYTDTPNAALNYTGQLLTNSVIPVMYWCGWNRRGPAPFSPGGTGADEFLINPSRINTTSDVFAFTTPEPTRNDEALGKEALKNIKVVPNPYFAKSVYDKDNLQRVIKFTNLPRTCTIRIFNLAGDLVRTMDKTDTELPYYDWDLWNHTGIPIASGVYIWHVESEYGEQTGKMAVFPEQERLDTY